MLFLLSRSYDQIELQTSFNMKLFKQNRWEEKTPVGVWKDGASINIFRRWSGFAYDRDNAGLPIGEWNTKHICHSIKSWYNICEIIKPQFFLLPKSSRFNCWCYLFLHEYSLTYLFFLGDFLFAAGAGLVSLCFTGWPLPTGCAASWPRPARMGAISNISSSLA